MNHRPLTIKTTLLTAAMWGLSWLAAGLVLLVIAGPDIADVPFPLGFGALGFFSGGIYALVSGYVRYRSGRGTLDPLGTAVCGAAAGVVLSSGICAFAIGSGNETTAILVMIPVLATAAALTAVAGFAFRQLLQSRTNE